MDIAGKKIAILGAGTSGLAAGKLAKSRGAEVSAWDSGASDRLAERVRVFADEGISLTTGIDALNAPTDLDAIVISPGIDTRSTFGAAFVATGSELMGEIEFAWRLGNAKVIGITGTNGKTTTTDLLSKILNDCGLRTVACGNFGLALSEVVLSGKEYDWYTIELSSFQLETISKFRANIAVWMNFAPDHMDRYDEVEEYYQAKLRVFENQTDEDWSVIKEEERMNAGPKVVTFSSSAHGATYQLDGKNIVGKNGEVLLDYSKTKLNGRHNAENVMAAIAAAECAGIQPEDTVKTIYQYVPPPHRCEVVSTISGATYVNDSKATNLHALTSSLSGQDSPVVLIAGGKEKGLDFAELTPLVETHVREVICIGEISSKILACWNSVVPCTSVETLEGAVQLASAKASEGDVVLFSPGTSSFDMFSGYEERGEVFRRAVQSLN